MVFFKDHRVRKKFVEFLKLVKFDSEMLYYLWKQLDHLTIFILNPNSKEIHIRKKKISHDMKIKQLYLVF
jgi:hypothetical protein